jgi:4-hydroxy-2-oxoheptanedioate aldolase
MASATAFSLAHRLRAGETVYSGWSTVPSVLGAEVLAREGFASVVIDMQHGLWDTAEVVNAIGAVRLGGAAPIVRIPLGDFAMASRALDFGAEAIIAPMINTPADARALVAATKYPPLGERSWGPHRALMQTGMTMPDYLKSGNSLVLTFAMIETRMALENVESIAATEGIDALFVGPSDLSIALSNGASLNQQAPELERALDRIGAAAAKAGKLAGLFCGDAARALAVAKRGYRFLSVGSDLAFLRAGAAEQMKLLKG